MNVKRLGVSLGVITGAALGLLSAQHGFRAWQYGDGIEPLCFGLAAMLVTGCFCVVQLRRLASA